MTFESPAANSLEEDSPALPKPESAPRIKNFGDAESVRDLIFMVSLRGGSVLDSQGNKQSAEYIQQKVDALRKEMYQNGTMSDETLSELTRSDGLRASVKRLVEAEYPGINNKREDFILDLDGDLRRQEAESGESTQESGPSLESVSSLEEIVSFVEKNPIVRETGEVAQDVQTIRDIIGELMAERIAMDGSYSPYTLNKLTRSMGLRSAVQRVLDNK